MGLNVSARYKMDLPFVSCAIPQAKHLEMALNTHTHILTLTMVLHTAALAQMERAINELSHPIFLWHISKKSCEK